MPTDFDSPPVGQGVALTLTLRELTEVLIKHHGLHTGWYDLLTEFQIGSGAVGPDPHHLSPGIMIGIGRIGLMPVSSPNPNSMDAAIVNPAVSISAKKRTPKTNTAP